MGNFGDAIKYLYEKFILRDVLSFVTPGAIIVLAASLLFLSGSLTQQLGTLLRYSSEIHWLLYIPLFGIFYIVGFAVQCLGELFDLIRFTPRDQGTWNQRFRIFCCNWASPSNIWWKDAHKDLVDFHEKTQANEREWTRQQHERLVVLKQMCANSFSAIVIAGILFLIDYLQTSLWFLLIVAFPLLASLLWGYRVHVLRQDTIAKAIRHLPYNGTQES